MTKVSPQRHINKAIRRADKLATYLAAAALVLVTLMPTMLQADEGDPNFEAMLERMGESSVPDATEALPETSLSAVNVGVQWRLWQRSLDDGGPGLDELDALRHDAVSVGIPTLPYHQAAVLHTARTGQQRGLDERDMRRLIEKADALAPHLPYADLEMVHWRLDRDLSSFPRAIPAYSEGLQKTYGWLDTRIAWALKGSLFLLIALGVAFLGFLLGQLLRYFGIAAYDGTRVMPRGFSSTQTVIVLLAVVLVPGLILQSPLLSMILLLVLVTPFQQINERLVAACFFALLAALPWLDDQVGRFLDYPGSDAQRLLHAHYHGCPDDDCRTWLDGLGTEEPNLAAYVSKVDRFRTATSDDMIEIDEWLAAQDLTSDERLAAQWLNFHGAVLIARGESEKALPVLEQASSADGEAAAPWFNKMRAHQVLGDDADSQRALEQAFALDLWATSRRMELQRRDPHSFLMIDFADSDLFWEDHAPGVDGGPGLIAPVWTVVAGEDLDFSSAPLLGFIALIALFLTLPLRLSRRVSTPCPKCGLARDPKEAEDTGHHHYCRPCYQTFVSGSSMDYHARVHSEATLGRRDRLQSGLRRIFSLISPGVGHIMGGHAIRGTIVLFLITTGLLLILMPHGPAGTWRSAFELFRFDWVGQNIVAWLLISIGGSLALTGLLRGIEPTRVRSPSSKKRGSS